MNVLNGQKYFIRLGMTPISILFYNAWNHIHSFAYVVSMLKLSVISCVNFSIILHKLGVPNFLIRINSALVATYYPLPLLHTYTVQR